MDGFSWSDTVHAVLGQCLPCLSSTSSNDDQSHRANLFSRSEELETLLVESEHSDVDALSLHSNFGQSSANRLRQKKKRRTKAIRFFGYNLFGRAPIPPSPPTNADQSSALLPPPAHRQPLNLSSSTLDSDASPVTDARLAELSQRWEPPLTVEDLRREEEEQRIKEERKAARRHRKEAKHAAAALATTTESAAELGDRAIGSHYPQLYTAHPSMGYDDFGPFEQAPSHPPIPLGEDDEEMDGADFGADTYARRPKGGSRASGSETQSHTHSQSRTSDSHSADGNSRHPSPHIIPLPPSAGSDTMYFERNQVVPKKKKKSSKSRSSKSTTSSQSSALRSPQPSSPSGLIHIRNPDAEDFQNLSSVTEISESFDKESIQV